MVHAAILRSPHAHARIRGDRHAAARKGAPGVVAVYTGADTDGALKPMPCAWLLPNADLKVAPYRALATDVVRYVGDAVAVVVAETPLRRRYDALELIDVDYEPLPAVVDPQKAAADGRAAAARRRAEQRRLPLDRRRRRRRRGVRNRPRSSSSDRIIQQRLIPTAMEPRGGAGAVRTPPPAS